ncbi:winged helix-turn-helix domain-containing protein [Virgibacillus siamensis]|uniref:winged helix-turn-helix domain-containing protein n=1 Tax=Virgibacillus siamensis TaxID=480071 RepID=UPI0009878499|nr:winged helix-turn-helix domain-containing protein [Virgibacillus siamensis]
MENIAKFIQHDGCRALLTILLNGRYYPISDLAYMTGMTTQEIRTHVNNLSEENIVAGEINGRHSYYGIDNTAIKEKVKDFIRPMPKPEIRPLKQHSGREAVSYVRTCYSHLAGEAGVKLADALLEHGVVVKGEREFYVTTKGENFFRDLDIDISRLKSGKKCLDWTERRHHIAGPLGKALLEKFLERGWMERVPESRSLHITEEGKQQFRQKFALEI